MNYCDVMSLQGRYYIEADLNDRLFGFNDNQNIKLENKQIGKDWIDTENDCFRKIKSGMNNNQLD